MSGMSAIMGVMQSAARKASRNLLRDFGEVETLQVSRKGPADFVSRADRKAERTIHEELSRARPGYGFLMEEAGEIEGSDKSHRFIVDPLDGTTNFLHGIPHFAISIALEREIDGNPRELVAGMVYNPVTDDMWFAEKGRGAYINDGTRGGADRRLRPAQRTDFSDCIFATGVPFKGRPGHAKFLKELHKVMGTSAGVRRFGAASLDLAWTAAGRYDGFWERGLAPWDVAAGIVIAREAGLQVESLSGGNPEETGDIIVANETIFPMLEERVR
ncbi:inositol monophosphatase family protein [Algimonas porphyrae]|uniref:Inositol-1-monophosphatase n=1 Tax=Algimonas porphyrae TaxID=1128113 RepID=A0ABQ5V189_9PROT|nr:inositol monophosphatase family protein [Algimonas porphyrae]GLQ20444.1 inositol monophosphatase [Algimonas porphyrae]